MTGNESFEVLSVASYCCFKRSLSCGLEPGKVVLLLMS